MAASSLATGLRAANVTGLQWKQVDLNRQLAWIHPDQAKAGKAIPVPLNGEAVALISKQVGKHLTHVFSFRGRPITQVSTKAWYGALGRAGIAGFSLARSSAHLGELARAERYAAVRAAGDRRLGVDGHGAAVRASCRRSLSTLCGAPRDVGCGRKLRRHKNGTARKKLRACIAASP